MWRKRLKYLVVSYGYHTMLLLCTLFQNKNLVGNWETCILTKNPGEFSNIYLLRAIYVVNCEYQCSSSRVLYRRVHLPKNTNTLLGTGKLGSFSMVVVVAISNVNLVLDVDAPPEFWSEKVCKAKSSFDFFSFHINHYSYTTTITCCSLNVLEDCFAFVSGSCLSFDAKVYPPNFYYPQCIALKGMSMFNVISDINQSACSTVDWVLNNQSYWSGII